MDKNNENKRIEDLKRNLYSRKSSPVLNERRVNLKSENIEPSSDWQEDEYVMKNKNKSVPKWILIAAIIFFIISAGMGSFIFFSGSNMISTRNVDLDIIVPMSISAGEVFEMNIVIRNRNNVAMESTNLEINLPEGVRDPMNLGEPLMRIREDLGVIRSGESVEVSMDIVIFGEENTIKDINSSVEYRVEGSSARFFTESNLQITLSSSPILVDISNPREINSGQEFEFEFQITSNSTSEIKNLLMIVEYPFGFSFSSSDPSPASGNEVWRLGDLDSEDSRKITIKGSLEGQDNEERTFRFKFGTPRNENGLSISSEFISLDNSIVIRRPFIDILFSTEGNTSSQFISADGRRLNNQVRWTNNLPDNVIDAEVEVKFSGNALDRFSVSADSGGFFRSTEERIVWDKNSTPSLERINSGQSVDVRFNFSSIAANSNLAFGLVNPEIKMEVLVKGNQLSDTGAPISVESRTEKVIKISSNLNLSGSSFYNDGPFENTGPIPPRVDQETTYTINWSLGNDFNDTSNVIVRANLPPYVEWLGVYESVDENITYNPTTREVVWNVGKVGSGVGHSLPRRQVFFQVSLMPSTSQLGSSIQIINRTTLTGNDDFTGSRINKFIGPISTEIPSDSGHFHGIGNVAR